MAPKRSRPDKVFFRTESSCSMASRSARIRFDHSTIRLPSAVNPWKRWWRRTIGVPNSFSSCLMALERLGWDTLQCRAARLKWCSWASATRYSSWRKNISLPPKGGQQCATTISLDESIGIGYQNCRLGDSFHASPRRHAVPPVRGIDRLHRDRRRPAGALPQSCRH